MDFSSRVDAFVSLLHRGHILTLRLCRTLLEPMEMLLVLMLKWDPIQRGGKIGPDNKKPQCFEALEQILNMKVSLVDRLIS